MRLNASKKPLASPRNSSVHAASDLVAPQLSSNEFGRNAGGVFEAVSRMAECVGDVVWFDGALGAVVGVVCADGSVVWDRATADVHDKTGECLAWAEDRVRCCPMAHLLTSDGILLVSEREGGIRDVPDIHFIQRGHRGECGSTIAGEHDVFQSESFRSGAAGSVVIS